LPVPPGLYGDQLFYEELEGGRTILVSTVRYTALAPDRSKGFWKD